ncbi:ArnT family glycosyltransferase [Sphingobium nicotianae]|uniref:Glycosyltransferase family 39 protein n=1 Tax=Sphingobium nicotianae TaxID=2782607 RepID=A0A9X1DBG0_9SPHN|nr:glycosyltransferase family 39 protein [Sphingobium nicotianae]MBT2186911.1 glycosyltransferase family 39 protein [Sphingobium nicotianae]
MIATAPAPASKGPAWLGGLRLPLILLLIATLARAQTFGNPVIEFDEQFYRLIGERMLDGTVPFVDIWDRKPIGLFLIYAFAALTGGEHALAYQLVALLFVAGTAWLVFLMAQRLCPDWRGPLVAAALYILWLNLLQGEGGQASVFTTLPTCAAALLVLRHVDGGAAPSRLGRDGALAMLLIGVALQIKYTVLLEGLFFGLTLLWLGSRAGFGLMRLAVLAVLWASLALLPTALAWGSYAVAGQGQIWLFANITSVFLRAPMPLDDLLGEMAGGVATILLLLVAAWFGWRRAHGLAQRFVALWALIAFLAMVPMRSFSPHYFIPLVPSLAILASPALAQMRRFAIGITVLAAVVGQVLIGFFIWSKGDRDTMDHLVAAIGPAPHCIFVLDGFPALYSETRSCLPGRFLFPGHLNSVVEAGSLGIDPVKEVERIMASRPDAVVTDWPLWSMRNLGSNAVVDRELAAHYRLALKEETGKGRFRMVWRRKAD